MIQTVILPWPTKDLSPNARVHYMALARAKKAYKHACWALAAQARMKLPADATPAVHLTFVPPSRRKYDDDNAVASVKAGLDGLAQAMGCDDSRWTLTHKFDREQIGGFVRVEVST